MKHYRTTVIFLGTVFLLLGMGTTAWATDYSGTLDFSHYPTTMELDALGTPVPVNVGIDVARYNLGNALSGAIDVSLTTDNFNPSRTLLGLIFATDPNLAIFENPTSLTGAINPTTNMTDFLDDHVTGWQYYAYGNSIVPNSTTSISGLFNPMSFTTGATYYGFVFGGSVRLLGTLVDPSVHYTLSVGAVPEPEEYAMMIAGLGLIGAIRRRRKGTALA